MKFFSFVAVVALSTPNTSLADNSREACNAIRDYLVEVAESIQLADSLNRNVTGFVLFALPYAGHEPSFGRRVSQLRLQTEALSASYERMSALSSDLVSATRHFCR